MKITVAAAALALAIGTAASAFAAPPTGAAQQAAPAAAHVTITTPAKALKADGTIKSVTGTGFTLTSGKGFKFDTGVTSASLKAGERVKVEYRMKNHERWATGVTPS